MASLIGQKLGQYEIIELLGQGGMATVYKAYQESIGRYVAIKVLPPHPGLDEQFIERFKLEAKTIGTLQHPHILPLYDYGTQEDILYLVMAYVDGGSLEDLLDSGRLPVKRIEKLLREIASALDYAHRRGVIHRDVKPANILIDSEGHALLADFGIVKMVGGGANLTGTGVIGTPAYIAPEQGQGLDVDGRADIYSLACVIFETLTGYQPYRSDTLMKIVLQHINDPIPLLTDIDPDLPEGLNLVLQIGMAKNPDRRFNNAVEFAEAISHAIHGNEESLQAIRKEIPLDRKAPSAQPVTKVFSEAEILAEVRQPTPTIIVQHTTNPLLFLAGFGLIALIIVVIAIALINQQNQAGAGQLDLTTTAVAQANIRPTLIPPPSVPTFGELRYNTTNSIGDTVNLRVNGLNRPTSGTIYVAWLKNTATDDLINIGEIRLDGSGDGILIYTDDDRRMLSGTFNSVAITEETAIEALPAGSMIYKGEIPPELSQTLYEILVTSPDGFGDRGLLASAITEAGTGQSHAGLAAGSRTLGSLRTHAEHTINIFNGTLVDYDGSDPENKVGDNPGRKIGVFFFLDKIDALLLNAVNNENATIYVQQNAENIFVCTTNVRTWAHRLNELELLLLAADNVDSVIPQAEEAETLAKAMLNGIDVNENGQIEAFEGECGLDQIGDFGIQVGNIDIVESTPDDSTQS